MHTTAQVEVATPVAAVFTVRTAPFRYTSRSYLSFAYMLRVRVRHVASQCPPWFSPDRHCDQGRHLGFYGTP